MTHPHAVGNLAQGIHWVLYGVSILSAIAAVLWSTWLIRAVRRDKNRERDGLCMNCGFDLRQSKDRCPECGEPVRGRKFHSH